MRRLVCVAIVLLAFACNGGGETPRTATPGPSPDATPTATATPQATATPTPVSTPTSQPPTATPQPLTEATVGDTITGVGKGYDTPGFTMTLLSWFESDIAVNGPYITGYYTFTAKPGMKFIILQYKFTNNWVKQQDTPYLNAGEIITAPNGYYYRVWSPPLGVLSEEYAPRLSTEEEIDRLRGDEGAYETLLPGEWVIGRVVFEIPKDMTPVEAEIAHVPAKIIFNR